MYTEGFEVKTNEKLSEDDCNRNSLILSSIDGRKLKEPVTLMDFSGGDLEPIFQDYIDMCGMLNGVVDKIKDDTSDVATTLKESSYNIRESCTMNVDTGVTLISIVSRNKEGKNAMFRIIATTNEDGDYSCTTNGVREEILQKINQFAEGM